VPAGSLAKAASVGANTVNGPLPFSVSTRPAALSAAARVPKLPAATAVSTMSLVALDLSPSPLASAAGPASQVAVARAKTARTERELGRPEVRDWNIGGILMQLPRPADTK